MANTPPTPAPKPSLTAKTKTVLTDITMVLGYAVTAGEAILTQLPSGPVNTAVAIGLPVVTALIGALTKLGG